MDWLRQHYGNLASVIGLLLSLATLWVAALTKRKVDRIRKEVFDQVNRVDAVWTTGALELALSEMLAFSEGKNWPLAIDRCRSAIKLLYSLRSNLNFEEGEMKLLRSAIDDLKMILPALERKRQRNDSHALEANKQSRIADLSAFSATLKEKLSRNLLEAPQ